MNPLVRLRAPFAALAAAVVTVPVFVVAGSSAARADQLDTVVGELVQAWPEFAHAHEADQHAEQGPLSWVETADGDSVRVPTAELPRSAGLAAGALVEVTVGGEVRDEAADEGLEPARTVVDVEVLEAAPTSSALVGGTNQVTVVMVQPGGVPTDGRRLADVVSAVDGPVRTFWAEQTGGQVQLQVTGQRDWMVTTATCASPSSLWNEVASAVGWAGGPGRHLLLYVSRAAPGCGAGLAQVGSGIGSGGRLWVTDVLTSLIAHEFGHNFSLGHASLRQCDGSVDAGSCSVTAYGDGYDVMGYSWSQVGSLGAPHAARLNVLPPARVVALTAADPATTVSLSPVAATSGVRALTLTDGSTQYWVELRSATGTDGWLGTPQDVFGLGTGVLVRQSATGQNTSLLLDATPSPAASWSTDSQTALRTAGQRVVLAGGRFEVELVQLTATSAQVRVLSGADVMHPVDALHRRLGGDAGPLGPARAALACGLPAGGCAREYLGGLVSWSPATGAQVMGSVELAAWRARGGASGVLGYPVDALRCTAACYQTFQGGHLVRDVTGRPALVWGALGSPWRSTGGADGRLGRPLGEPACGRRAGGCSQHFQGGSVYWSPASGAHVVLGAIGQRWAQQGRELGGLGYPVGGEVCGLRGGGCFQAFQGGSVYWSPASGAHVVLGAIGQRWAQQGWELGGLGYPVGNEVCGLRDGGCFQPFQGGAVYWSPRSGAHPVGGWAEAIRRAWEGQGWERGRLGYPVDAPHFVLRGGVVLQQRFQGGLLVVDGRGQVSRR
ncbi:hypothetical protein [Candidatus Blastococcus massiliensis]|uniref:hypothetical protein n=1 Tax=Candidatus Blastococcus massiliensis TaxID=1470358 RepID=UPI0004B3250E|nr:hypothetical protein [Candidatus Blastococcus massiliensis]